MEIKNIENLYTDECTNVASMFDQCISLKEINLKYFETSNVENMKYMFFGCSSLKYLDLSSFDISKSKNWNFMMDTNTSTTIKANQISKQNLQVLIQVRKLHGNNTRGDRPSSLKESCCT